MPLNIIVDLAHQTVCATSMAWRVLYLKTHNKRKYKLGN